MNDAREYGESGEGAHPTDHPYIWENAYGFFFADEAEQLNGPYPNRVDAIIALNDYVEYLNMPKASNTTANLPQSTVRYYK